MDLNEIKRIVGNIEYFKDDYELAHILEDTLYQKFVKYIAETGNEEQKEMAKAISQTDEINFDRGFL